MDCLHGPASCKEDGLVHLFLSSNDHNHPNHQTVLKMKVHGDFFANDPDDDQPVASRVVL